MSQLLSFFLPLFCLICLGGLFVLFFRCRFEEALPFSLMSVTLVVYLFALAGALPLGYGVALAAVAAFPVLIVLGRARRKPLAALWQRMFTPGFAVFLLLYLFVFVVNWRRGFAVWDEITHWGLMVKETLRLNALYSAPASVLGVHKDYPPIVPLFQALWCRVAGGYSESLLYRALQTFSLALFLPALRNWQWGKGFWRSLARVAVATAAILTGSVLLVVGEAAFYHSIYLDCLLGLLLAHCALLVLQQRSLNRFGLLRLGVAGAFLLLTKQMGLVFYLLVLALWAVQMCVLYWPKRTQLGRHLRKMLWPALTLGVLPAAFFLSWSLYVRLLQLDQQFSLTSIRPSQLLGVARGTGGEPYQHEAFVNYSNALLNRPLLAQPSSLTYWQLLLVFILLAAALAHLARGHLPTGSLPAAGTVLVLGGGGYALAMLLLYCFSFGAYEGPSLACFSRYMLTYPYALGVFCMLLLLWLVGQKAEDSLRLAGQLALGLCLLWGLVLEADNLNSLTPSLRGGGTTAAYAADAALLEESTPADARIYVVAQNTNGEATNTLLYLASPRLCNLTDYSLGQPYNEGDVWTSALTPEEWQERLGEYDYLYLQQIDEAFVAEYGSLFTQTPTEKGLYTIAQGNGGLVLTQIA